MMEEPYRTFLKDIFPTRSDEAIDNVIEIIEESELEDEFKLDTMVLMLTESGDSTLESFTIDDYEDVDLGFGHVIETINSNQSDLIFVQLSDILPDADPDYLRGQSEKLALQPDLNLQEFVESAIEKHDYPHKREYYKRQKKLSEAKKYTENFSVEHYLDVIPDPVDYFNTSYKSVLTLGNASEEDEKYAIICLLNTFPYLREKDIKKVFDKFNKDVIKTCDNLARIPRHFKAPRKLVDNYEDICENIQLLQELAFIKHKQQIKTTIKMKNHLYRVARAEAEKYNLLETCQCCFFEGLLPEECFFCKKTCVFCKECVAKGAEHVIGKGEIVFPCLSNCNSEFDVATLKMVLDKKVFEPLFTKIQMEEVRNANIDGLETCPFCDFSMIITSDDEKIFKCLNTECMEESCRECRQKSHVPLKCKEVEYDEDVKKRTYIENKMTEALLRTCWRCQKSFFKGSGCNKMTCPCGAQMCYVCGANNIDYSHFGALSENKCPLHTADLKKFHADRVRNSALRAKAELGITRNPSLLKIDPTEDLEEYFDAL